MTARHGHVVPRRNGAVARCGGPGLCETCQHEQRQVRAVAEALHHRCLEHWAELERTNRGPVTQHGHDAHTTDARLVLMALDEVGPELRS